MILQSLVKYYETLEKKGEITRPGWSKEKAAFALVITENGELNRVIPLKIEKLKGKKMVWDARTFTVPQRVTRSSGIASNFLCDHASYLLGIDKKGKPKRTLECFLAAKAKHLEILEGVDSIAARAVCNFFKNWQPEHAANSPALADDLEEIMSGENLIFQVEDIFAQEDSLIKKAWEKYSDQTEKGVRGACLVTGQQTEIARIHGTIKGVQGAQSSGAALVSFNAPVFESYGKEQSFNAPVGTYAVYAYTTVLNHLLADRSHTTTLGDTTIVYWAEEGEESYQEAFRAVSEPTSSNQEIVKGVFHNLESGQAIHVPTVETTISLEQKFFILGLAPNAARLSVRFFYQDSFGNILKHLKNHYDRMEIVKSEKDTLEYLGIWRMLQETVNKKSRDKKPVSNMAGAVYRAILSDGRYPDSLYQAVLLRLRADQDNSDAGIYKITRGRASIIKAYLLRNGHRNKEEITMAWNENCVSIPYNLGGTFAVLEVIQEAMQKEENRKINATIKDKYFNSACETPASIFPILLKLKNSHIRKLSSRGLENYYEAMLAALQDKIPVSDNGIIAYPRHLSLEEQGMFILGYYQQKQKIYQKKSGEETKDGRGN